MISLFSLIIPFPLSDNGWFSTTADSNSCLTTIRKRASFVFSGHIHSPPTDYYTRDYRYSRISCTGAFFVDEWRPNRPVSFSAGWIDTDKKECRYYSFVCEATASERKWFVSKDEEPRPYRKPAKPSSLDDSRVSKIETIEAKAKEFPTVRRKDFEAISSAIQFRKGNTMIVWITGFPGIGKTTLAFDLSDVLFSGTKPIFIKRGHENNLRAVASHSTRLLLRNLVSCVEENGDVPIESLAADELLAVMAEVVSEGQLWFIIEAGEGFSEETKPNLVRFIDMVIAAGKSLSAVVTSRDRPKEITDPPHFVYELHDFTLEDVLALSRGRYSKDFVQELHERFRGHPLSVSAFLSEISKIELRSADEKELRELLAKVPQKTSELLKELWTRLPSLGQSIVSAISDIPELGIDRVVALSKDNQLERSGLLSAYPSSLPGGIEFYVHPLVSEVCCSTMSIQSRLDAKCFVLETLYSDKTLLALGPVLAKSSLEKGDMNRCRQLIHSDGRAWIEVAGIHASKEVLDLFLSLNGKDDIALYNLGLCYLFSGKYEDAESVFRSLLAGSAAASPFALAIQAETMECLRRRGRVLERSPSPS